eukprot:2765987-Amphidinium_carterae.1
MECTTTSMDPLRAGSSEAQGITKCNHSSGALRRHLDANRHGGRSAGFLDLGTIAHARPYNWKVLLGPAAHSQGRQKVDERTGESSQRTKRTLLGRGGGIGYQPDLHQAVKASHASIVLAYGACGANPKQVAAAFPRNTAVAVHSSRTCRGLTSRLQRGGETLATKGKRHWQLGHHSGAAQELLGSRYNIDCRWSTPGK